MDLLLFTTHGNVHKMKAFEIKDHKPSDLGEFSPNLLNLADGEKIACIHLTDDYGGQFIIGFANGRMVRIPCNAYETKTNRKKLIHAFNTESPVVAIHFLSEPEEFVAISSIRKVLVFNSEAVPVKATRTTQGVQILLQKKGSTLQTLERLKNSTINDPAPYRARTLPAAGLYLKEGTLASRQVSLDGI
jgi:DNA gyrase subunit A